MLQDTIEKRPRSYLFAVSSALGVLLISNVWPMDIIYTQQDDGQMLYTMYLNERVLTGKCLDTTDSGQTPYVDALDVLHVSGRVFLVPG